MDVKNVFHMNGGIGQTSYAKNSSIQKETSDKVKPITMETLLEFYLATSPKSLQIADLGCSSGHNSLLIIREMVDIITRASHKISKKVPEFRVHLNDLPTNDFNVTFSILPEFYKEIGKENHNEAPCVYVGAYPGSFYGRLFPNKSLHFVYCSHSLHWLSKVPDGLYDEHGSSINKASMYISESSPPQVAKVYYRQFHDDMSVFLKSRAEEVVDDGKMVLILMGRIGANHIDRGNYLFWELLAQSFAILVSQGDVDEEKLASYNMHFYAPSKEEIEIVVKGEGSFEVERLEILEMDRKNKVGLSYGKAMASTARAVQESTIKRHFGDNIADKLFDHYARLLDEENSREKIREITLVVVLKKRKLPQNWD